MPSPSQSETFPGSSYHSHHAPLGGFASFTIGRHGVRGGFGQSLAGPAQQNVLVGYRTGEKDPWLLLPFFDDASARGEDAFTGSSQAPRPASRQALGADAFSRVLGWATDTWRAGNFEFGLATPWDRTPDPANAPFDVQRRAFAPVVYAWIEFDNRTGRNPVELVFGLSDPAHLWRPLSDTNETLLGFAHTHSLGYATLPGANVEARQGFAFEDPRFRDDRGLHLLGPENALVFRVPPAPAVASRSSSASSRPGR